jgi:hypothetical protein
LSKGPWPTGGEKSPSRSHERQKQRGAFFLNDQLASNAKAKKPGSATLVEKNGTHLIAGATALVHTAPVLEDGFGCTVLGQEARMPPLYK